MKKVVGLVTLLTAGIVIGTNVSELSVSAASINLDDNAPRSGSIKLNDKDKVVSASSTILYKLAKKAENESISLFADIKTAINFANSRWVYYTDHHNYINGYKVGHSNYYHTKESHTSTACIGNHCKRAVAGPKQWSYATASGKGTFSAYYYAPYK